MNKAFVIFLLFGLSVTLCSCPYSSAYNLDAEPTIYVEDVLLGTWVGFIEKEGVSTDRTVNMTLTKRTDTEYDIAFSGYVEDLRRFRVVEDDTIKGTAFMSTVDGMQFLNIKVYARVYIAELQLKDEGLSLLPLAEHFTGKMIFSSDELKNSVSFHYKTRVHPILDDEFCLRRMVKIQ